MNTRPPDRASRPADPTDTARPATTDRTAGAAPSPHPGRDHTATPIDDVVEQLWISGGREVPRKPPHPHEERTRDLFRRP